MGSLKRGGRCSLLRALAAPSHVEWSFPVRTLIGAGRRSEIPEVLAGAGASRPLVVTDPGLASLDFFPKMLDHLKAAGLSPTPFSGVHPNPLDTDVHAGTEEYRRAACDSVVCVGGGSAMDAGKCISMVAESGLTLSQCDYWEPESPQLPAGGRLPHA